MTDIHPAAPHHVPGFLPGPDGSDPLFTAVVVGLLVIVMVVGVLYFKLHALPEKLGEKHNSAQLQLISVLAVLALFTHNNAFWVIALLIAVVRIPDFLTPLQTIAASLSKIAAQNGGDNVTDPLRPKQVPPSRPLPPEIPSGEDPEPEQTEKGEG